MDRIKARRHRPWRGRRRDGSPVSDTLREAMLSLLERMGGTPGRAGLQRLWDNWEAALGAELAGLARPLGSRAPHKGGEAGTAPGFALLLAAEDAMLLQELRFRGEEILERVNGFLGMAYFCEVKVSLPLGRDAPVRSRAQVRHVVPPDAERQPAATGVFLPGMDCDSPVARCYARFARQQATQRKKAAEEPEESGGN